MKANNDSHGSDMRFVWWDDLGDSQEHVDKQCSCDGWKKEIQEKENGGCCNHAKQQDEDEKAQDLRWRAIMQNGNEGTHYPEYEDYMDDSNDD